VERGRARNSLRDGGRDPPLDLELEDCALRLDAEAKRTALTDHVADQDPEQGADDDRREPEPWRDTPDGLERRQRDGADEDAEDAAADRASDAAPELEKERA